MNKIIDHRHAHQLSDIYHESDRSLCVIVKDSKEAKLLKNEIRSVSFQPAGCDLAKSEVSKPEAHP